MMSFTEWVVDWLWRYGHFRNPAYPNTHNVQRENLQQLSLADEVVQTAIKSIQELDLNAELKARAYHPHRIKADDPEADVLIADGDLGPATLSMMNLDRCGEPDFVIDYGDDVEFGTEPGNGGWPNCAWGEETPPDDILHSVRWHINDTNATAYQKSTLDWCIDGVVRCSAEMGLAVRVMRNTHNSAPEPVSELSVVFERIPGGTIGYQYLPKPNTCKQHQPGRLDTGYNPSDRNLFLILMIHESAGHGANLGHSRGGIMNPSILNVTPSWIGDPSEVFMTRMYTGVAIDWPRSKPGPGPEPEPGEGRLVFRPSDKGYRAEWYGDGRLVQDGDHLGEFHLVPVPEV